MIIAAPGNIGYHQATAMYCDEELLSIPPHEGSFGGVPTPRKLKLASEIIAPPRWKVVITI
jgi:hypothetical protein